MTAASFWVAGTSAAVALAVATAICHAMDTGKALNHPERRDPGGSVDETSLVRIVFGRAPVARFYSASDAIVLREAPNAAVYLAV